MPPTPLPFPPSLEPPPPHARSRANGVAQVFAPETTLAIVKPAAFASADQVLAAAVAEGFLVLAKSEFTLTKEQAQRAPLSLTRPPSRPPWSPGARLLRDSCATPLPRRIPQASQFYASHAGQPYFGEWVDALSGGPLLAAVLEKPFAVDEWATMLGPEDPSPGDATSLRGRFGALHGSRSLGVAASEAAFFFGDSLTKQQAAGAHATPDDAGNRHRRPPALPTRLPHAALPSAEDVCLHQAGRLRFGRGDHRSDRGGGVLRALLGAARSEQGAGPGILCRAQRQALLRRTGRLHDLGHRPRNGAAASLRCDRVACAHRPDELDSRARVSTLVAARQVRRGWAEERVPRVRLARERRPRGRVLLPGARAHAGHACARDAGCRRRGVPRRGPGRLG